jgi:hypothetical protein
MTTMVEYDRGSRGKSDAEDDLALSASDESPSATSG